MNTNRFFLLQGKEKRETEQKTINTFTVLKATKMDAQIILKVCCR